MNGISLRATNGFETGMPGNDAWPAGKITIPCIAEKNEGYAMRRVVTIVLIFLVTVIALGCHKETDQNRIKKIITEVQTAGEQKDVKKIMGHLSKAYSDPQGFNYEGIKGLVLGYFLRFPKISVYINNLDISTENATGRAVFQTVFTSGEKTGSVTDAIPRSLGIYDFDVSLKKESRGWKVTAAKWERVEIFKPGGDGNSRTD